MTLVKTNYFPSPVTPVSGVQQNPGGYLFSFQSLQLGSLHKTSHAQSTGHLEHITAYILWLEEGVL